MSLALPAIHRVRDAHPPHAHLFPHHISSFLCSHLNFYLSLHCFPFSYLNPFCSYLPTCSTKNLSNPPCQVISFSLNCVPSGAVYLQFSISCLSPLPGVAVPLLQCFHHLSSHHSPAKPNCSHLSWHFLTFSSFCFCLGFSFMAQQNSVLAYFTFLILSFTLFMVLYSSASSFLVLLSLMHFLYHSVLQAFHIEIPALPQIPLSLLVSIFIMSLSCCPRKCIFSKLENSSKHRFCTVKKEK